MIAAFTLLLSLAINVRDHGAVGDGITDDRPAIQYAANLLAAGGGTLYFPSGSYFLSLPQFGQGGLSIPSNVLVYGQGASSVILYTNASAALYNTDWRTVGNSNITVRDITINLRGLGNNGIDFSGVQFGTVDNVRVIDPHGYGIYINSVTGTLTRHVTISNCHVSGVVDTGIELRGVQNCLVVGNTVSGRTNLAGIVVWDGAADCTVTGNCCEGEVPNAFTAFGVFGRAYATGVDTRRLLFSGNVASNARMGFKIAGEPEKPSLPSHILVTGNSISGCGGGSQSVGVYLAQCDHVSFMDNQIVDCAIVQSRGSGLTNSTIVTP